MGSCRTVTPAFAAHTSTLLSLSLSFSWPFARETSCKSDSGSARSSGFLAVCFQLCFVLHVLSATLSVEVQYVRAAATPPQGHAGGRGVRLSLDSVGGTERRDTIWCLGCSGIFLIRPDSKVAACLPRPRRGRSTLILTLRRRPSRLGSFPSLATSNHGPRTPRNAHFPRLPTTRPCMSHC